MAASVASLALLFMLQAFAFSQDPCTSYRILHSGLERSVSSVFSPESTALQVCDRGIETGWYRVVSPAGDLMATSCPRFNECGTSYPVWMRDDLNVPEGTTLSREVCLTSDTDCCASSWTIQVRNCTDFLVYYLNPTPACPQAYCIGRERPCPAGQCSDTGYTPDCSTECLGVTLNPVVTPDLETEQVSSPRGGVISIAKLIFKCSFDEPQPDLAYDVSWFIDDYPIRSFLRIPSSNLLSTHLREEDWKDNHRLGMHVVCTVRARLRTDTPATVPFKSAAFFAGLKRSPDILSIREGEKKTISVYSTVPIGGNLGEPSRYIEVYVFHSKYQREPDVCRDGIQEDDLTFESDQCGVRIEARSWSQASTLTVTGYVDNMYNAGTRTSLVFLGTDGTPSHPVQSSQRLPRTQVVVSDASADLRDIYCKYWLDPNLRQFNHHGNTISNTLAGEHVLFKHNTLPIRVHTLSTKCQSAAERGTCVCGLAIQSFGNYLVMNYCPQFISERTVSGPYNKYTRETMCDDSTFILHQTGSEYKLTLPTGTMVEWTQQRVSWSDFVGPNPIRINPSPVDVGQTSGLCGNTNAAAGTYELNDGSSTTDVTTFLTSWRVISTSPDTLFGSNVRLDENVYARPYCRCARRAESSLFDENDVHCNLTAPIQQCTSQLIPANRFVSYGCNSRRFRRDAVASDLEAVDVGLQFDEELDTAIPEIPEWKAPWNETTARAECERAFSLSSAVGMCEEMSGDRRATEESIQACISDIKVSGGAYFVTGAVEAYKVFCLQEANRNETLQISNTTSDFYVDLLGSLCPGDCNRNGTCVEGKCECMPGYIGVDCSLKISEPPGDLQVPSEGLCDVTVRACASTSVTAGVNIPEEGSNITCGLTYFEVHADGSVQRDSNQSYHRAVHNFIQSVQCPLPIRRLSSGIAYGYNIALSNDGLNFGTGVDVIVYDSNCLTCNSSTVTCIKTGECSSQATTTTAHNAEVSTATSTASESSSGNTETTASTLQFDSSTTTITTSTSAIGMSSFTETTSSPTEIATPSTATKTSSPTGTGTPSPTGTGTPSPTGTGTPSPTGTGTPPTGTGTPSPTGTGTSSPTGTGTPSTETGTPSPTGTGTPSTETGTPSPTGTGTPSPTGTGTPSTGTGTLFPTGTGTPSPTGTGIPSPTGTETPSPTGTGTPFPTGTGTPSPTGTGTPSPTGTGTPSPTGTGTPSPTGTGTPSPTGTGTPPTGTGTTSPTGAGTTSPTGTGTPSPIGTGTPSPTGTGTPSPIGTGTPSPAGTGTPSPTGTGTPFPTGIGTLPTQTGTPSPAGTGTPSPAGTGTPPPAGTGTPSPTGTGTTSPTGTGTLSPTGTGTTSPTGTGTPSPTGTGTTSPTGTGTLSPTGTGTLSPTGTGTLSPTGTGTTSPTGTGTPSPTGTGTPSPTETGTPSPTGTGTPSPTGTGTPSPIGTRTTPPIETGTASATGTATFSPSETASDQTRSSTTTPQHSGSDVVATTPSQSDTPGTTEEPGVNAGKSSGLSTGAIVGIALGASAVAVAVVAGVIIWAKKASDSPTMIIPTTNATSGPANIRMPQHGQVAQKDPRQAFENIRPPSRLSASGINLNI